MLARLSSKGQIVIPKEVRESLGLEMGTEFHVQIEAGRIVLQPIGPSVVDKLYGMFADLDLLSELENEHRQELRDEATLRP
jgi:AbrB family looped-hinge helix DNA binding protein